MPPPVPRSRGARDATDSARRPGPPLSGGHGRRHAGNTVKIEPLELRDFASRLGWPGPCLVLPPDRLTERKASDMTSTKMRWARVEYQIDLRSAQPRIPLGVVVIAANGSDVRAFVAGRAPQPGAPAPEELKAVGPLGRSQLDGWVAAMAKDVLAAFEKHEDALEALVSRWCWNLSVAVEAEVEARPQETLRALAARLLPLALPESESAGTHWSFAEVSYVAR
jgi:hypothetical protein